MAVGTGLAFLVKTLLVVSVSTAFCQIFWRTIKARAEDQSPPKLGEIDTVFASSSSLFAFLDVRVWLRYPHLILLALLVWLMPIASIIAPSTLTVNIAEAPPLTIRQNVSTIDFYNLNFAGGMGHYNDSGWHGYRYNGPSQSLRQLAAAVAGQNAILTVPAPSLNSSWQLTFAGPKLSCEEAPSAKKTQVQDNIARYLLQGNLLGSEPCRMPAAFLAWYKGALDSNGGRQGSDPYLSSSTNESELVLNTNTQFSEALAFYIAVLPQTLLVKSTIACPDIKVDNSSTNDNSLGAWGEDMTLLQCQLYNTTYQTNFTFVNGAQEINVRTLHPEQDTVISPIINSLVGGPGEDLFGTGSTGNNATCTTLNKYPAEPCSYDASILPLLAYQSVLQSFGELIMGDVSLAAPVTGEGGGDSRQLNDNSRVRATNLMDTKELAFLTDYAMHPGGDSMTMDLQGRLMNSSHPEISGMSRLPRPDEHALLKDALETMFQNLTMSLMSSAAFRPDPSLPNTISETPVTQTSFRTVYFYAAAKLWIAYGSAISATAIAVAIGLLSMATHGATYSNKFSTAFLAGRAAELSVEVHHSDLQARGPLPPYLGRAKVALKPVEPVAQVVQEREEVKMGGGVAVYSSVRQVD